MKAFRPVLPECVLYLVGVRQQHRLFTGDLNILCAHFASIQSPVSFERLQISESDLQPPQATLTPPMATNSIYSQMDNWSRTMLSRLEEKDPIFACHARNELSNIARAYPYGTFPQFYSPGPPSRVAPIFPSPRPAFTPLHSGGNPNGGVQGLPSDRPCFCGNLTACRCSSWCPPTPAPLPTSPPRPKSPFVTMNSGAGTPNTGVQGLPGKAHSLSISDAKLSIDSTLFSFFFL